MIRPLQAWIRAPLPVRVGACAAAATAVYVASNLQPGGGGGGFLPGYVFNLAHVPLYGLVALAVLALFGSPRAARIEARFIAILIALAAGVWDEWNQAGVPGRDSAGLDLVSDGLGAIWAVSLASCELKAEASGASRAHLFGFGLAVVIIWGFLLSASPASTPLFPSRS